MSIDKLKQEHDLTIKYYFHPFQPDIPQEGLHMKELIKGKGFTVEQALFGMKSQAEKVGLEFGMAPWAFNSRLAQELSKWAETKSSQEAFNKAAFHGYFVEGKNLAQMDVLLELAEKAGLDPKEAKEVVESRSFKEAVDVDYAYSEKKAVQAIPTFFRGEKRLVGAKPYAMLERLIKGNAGEDLVYL